MPSNKILLSFDVEEFDIPLEYGQPVAVAEQLAVGYKGLQAIMPLLTTAGLHTTLFTTAFFAENYSPAIKALSGQHEIASHTYHHSAFEQQDLLCSKQKLESITGVPVTGLRMPRLRAVEPAAVLAAGYTYNSSINPTWLPGRYNHLSVPRHPFTEGGLLQFPVSVTPRLRIPLFWLLFKNMPYPIYLRLARQTLQRDGYLCLYFHPWEFIDLAAYRLPGYVKRGSDKSLLQKLHRLVKDLSVEGEYISMQEFIACKS
jgi:peptidoglycan/xylan/chitin deacetylase (PgdA/CDA1 family)